MVTFGLVHGSWQGAWVWGPLREELHLQGHRSVAVDMPCEDPAAGAADYAAVMCRAIERVRDPVVLVGHSLGGLTIPLVAAERDLLGLVFLAAGIPRVGMSYRQQAVEEGIRVPGSYDRAEIDAMGRTRFPPDVAVDILYQASDPERARWAAGQLRWQSQRIIDEITPLTRMPHVPSRYVVCHNDRILQSKWQLERGAALIGDTAPVQMRADHSPMLSRPRELAEHLSRIAEGFEPGARADTQQWTEAVGEDS